MSSPKVLLISGAARGIGYSIVKAYSTDANMVIIAGVRDISKATALAELAKTSAAKIHLIVLDAASEESNKKAAVEVAKLVDHIDVLLANAGGVFDPDPILTTPTSRFIDAYVLNALGPVFLFKSFWSLLDKAKGDPKFLITSSMSGSSTINVDFNNTPYEAAKSALNRIARRIHSEFSDRRLIVVPFHPGLVRTEPVQALFDGMGIDSFPGVEDISPDESGRLIKELEQKVTFEEHGGNFLNNDGTPLPY